MRMKIQKILSVIVAVATLLVARPSNAFVWPCIDISMIGKFVSSVSTGIGEVTSAKTQIQGYVKQIQSIGSEVSVAAKYSTSHKDQIMKLVQSIEDFQSLLKLSAKSATEIMQMNENEITEDIDDEEDIEDFDAEEKYVQEDAEENTEETTKTVEVENYEQWFMRVEWPKYMYQINGQIKLIEESDDLSKEDKQELITDVNNVVNKNREIIHYYSEMFEKRHEVYVECEKIKEEAVKKAEQLMEDAELEIKRREKEAALQSQDVGEMLKKLIEIRVECEKIREEAVKKAEQLMKDAELEIERRKKEADLQFEEDFAVYKKMLEEEEQMRQAYKDKVKDKIANNKEYSDADDVKDKLSKLSFHFSTEQQNLYLGGIYSDIDNTFLFSKEFKCSKLELDQNAIGEDSKWVDQFRECVVRAKTDKEYFCPNEKSLKNCDVTKQEPGLYDAYIKEGVYKHILEDYSIASISSNNVLKQKITQWLDKDNGTPKTIQDVMSKGADNTRAGTTVQSMIDIEMPKLWSKLRIVDAVERNRTVVNYFNQAVKLYINKDEEYKKAQESKSGKYSEGDEEDIDILSNVFPYLCEKKAEDFIVKKDSDDGEEQEKKIKECIYKYVEGATRIRSADEGSNEIVTDEKTGNTIVITTNQKWWMREVKALTDTMFDTLAMNTINMYKSSKDYDDKSKTDNIYTLNKDLGATDEDNGPADQMSDYFVGAKINKYTAQQLLTIVDADAQNLQTEIIQDMQLMTDNFFGDSKEE